MKNQSVAEGERYVLESVAIDVSKEGVSYTNIRWKSLGTHTALLKPVKSSVDAIAHQMKEMTNATNETESNKVEVQLNLFVEQMTCHTECDMCIYEQERLAADNAHLATIKHGEVVSALDFI